MGSFKSGVAPERPKNLDEIYAAERAQAERFNKEAAMRKKAEGEKARQQKEEMDREIIFAQQQQK